MASISVVGPAGPQRAWLAGAIDSLRLDPPVPLSLCLLAAPPDAGAHGAVFPQPFLEIRSGDAAAGVSIRWLAAPAVALLAAGATRADVWIAPESWERRELLMQSFVTAVLAFLLRRAGWHHVHAATAVDPGGRGWLFAGNTEAGKSTTAALLASRGWTVGGDDLAFLADGGDGVDVVAARTPIALRPGGAGLLGHGGGQALRAGRKTGFFPEDLGGSWTGRIRPVIIALPRVTSGATRLEPLARPAALAELVRWSALVALEADAAQVHLDLLGRLAGQARCYRLDLGPDLFSHHDLLLELAA